MCAFCWNRRIVGGWREKEIVGELNKAERESELSVSAPVVVGRNGRKRRDVGCCMCPDGPLRWRRWVDGWPRH